MRTPLAWQNLTANRGKFLLSAAGVGFAVLLMFMQIGFRNALLDSNVELIRLFRADLIVVSEARFNLSSERRFPAPLFASLVATDGVEQSCAVRTERVQAFVKTENSKAKSIRVISLEPNADFMASDDLASQLQQAGREGSALVDRRSKSAYGFDFRSDAALRQQLVELNNKRMPIAGSFELGTDFANDGTLLMSDRLFPKYFPLRSPNRDPMSLIDFGLIQLKDDADVNQVAKEIARIGKGQVYVYRMSDFVSKELNFWSRNTPIGIIFGIGTIMGLIVGAIICYQIQFTEISENMPELATLKAMGYGNGYFWTLILCQSFYLACIGFVPGLIFSWGLYHLLASASGLVMRLTLGRIVLVWLLTLIMCLISGNLAIRKLWRADPATLF